MICAHGARGWRAEATLSERSRWREMSDAELVRAMREGSYEALREFYLRFEPLLARYAARAGVLSGSCLLYTSPSPRD